MMKKVYEKPEQRVVRLQPCRMLALSGAVKGMGAGTEWYGLKWSDSGSLGSGVGDR